MQTQRVTVHRAVRRLVGAAWRRAVSAVMPAPVILMYHRVANDDIDPWGLCVSPANFAAQMAFLRARRRPLRLAELTEQLERGRRPRAAVVVTFDDGYRDNLEAALPVLEREQVPATVFCTAGAIGSGQAFWWDRLAALLLRPELLPTSLNLHLGGTTLVHELGDARRYDASQRAADRCRPDDAHASPRLRLYRTVWSQLRPLAPGARDAALAQIERWSPAAESHATALPLSVDQARSLAASRWIEIGAHSVSHAALPELDADSQREEIVQAKQRLEALVARSVTSFAYPFGAESAECVARVRDAGFRRSCTTETAAVGREADPLRLPRLAVGDWDAATLERALRQLQ